MKFNGEVTLGTVLQIVGYIVMAVYFTISVSSAVQNLKIEVEDLKTSMRQMSVRMDAHIDRGK